jgi:hypothetical protein
MNRASVGQAGAIMDLVTHIKVDRARQRRKRPHIRDLLVTVSCIVKANGLDIDFLGLIQDSENLLSRIRTGPNQVKTKPVFEFPPFSLVSEKDFELALEIVGRLDNPYLKYAHSPEEMLLSAPLFRADPDLMADVLLIYDLETLLLRAWAKEEVGHLERGLENSTEMPVRPEDGEEAEDREPNPGFLKQRKEQLLNFIAKVDTRESKPR